MKKMIRSFKTIMSQTQEPAHIKVPDVFLEQYGSDYMERFLETVADIYRGWNSDANPACPVSIMAAIREVSTMLSRGDETLESIHDTSPRDAMFISMHKVAETDNVLANTAEMICDDYEVTGGILYAISAIEKYIAETDGCKVDNFRALYLDKFVQKMGLHEL